MKRRVLHAGCGGRELPPQYFHDCEEVRLDIDQRCKPDIICSMVDMSSVPDGTFDAFYSSHTLEHLYPHDVRQCLWNVKRVLKPGGIAMVVVPNLENVKATEDVLYESASGKVSGLDMMYGHHAMVAENPYMAHHCGFVPETLKAAMESVGFENVNTVTDEFYNLTGMATAPLESNHV